MIEQALKSHFTRSHSQEDMYKEIDNNNKKRSVKQENLDDRGITAILGNYLNAHMRVMHIAERRTACSAAHATTKSYDEIMIECYRNILFLH